MSRQVILFFMVEFSRHDDGHRVAGRGLAGVVGGDDVDFQRLAAGLAGQGGVAVGDGGGGHKVGVHGQHLLE